MNPKNHQRAGISVKFRGAAAFVAILLLMVGCAPALIQLEKQELVRLKDQAEIPVVHYPPPALTIMTPGRAATAGMFGLIGGLIAGASAESEGKHLVKEYSLEDPALRVKEQVISALASKFDLRNFRSAPEALASDDLSELKTKFAKGTLLDFKTGNWALTYYPTDWNHYRVLYSIEARLIRVEDSKVMWLGFCKFDGGDPSQRPTLDELKANNGALLKTKLNEVADSCSEELMAQLAGEGRVK